MFTWHPLGSAQCRTPYVQFHEHEHRARTEGGQVNMWWELFHILHENFIYGARHGAWHGGRHGARPWGGRVNKWWILLIYVNCFRMINMWYVLVVNSY